MSCGNLEQVEPETAYEGRKQAPLRQITALVGKQFFVKKGQNEEVVWAKGRNKEVAWTVIPELHPDDVHSNVANDGLVLKISTTSSKKANSVILLAHIFFHIMLADWQEKLQRLNAAALDDFCKAHGILIAAAIYNCKGVELW
jgi:hypothetical protein